MPNNTYTDKIDESRNRLLPVVTSAIIVLIIMLFMGFIYGVWSFYHRGELQKEIRILKHESVMLVGDINKLADENRDLRKITKFEKTFLPYFSDRMTDKMLSVEGCLGLGG